MIRITSELTMSVIVRSCNGEPEGRGRSVREFYLPLDRIFLQYESLGGNIVTIMRCKKKRHLPRLDSE
jgi:hypothetical protein